MLKLTFPSRLPVKILVPVLGVLLVWPASAGAAESAESADGGGKQFYEVRTYHLGEQGDADALDAYLRDAYLPALKRQQIGPVGVLFDPMAEAADRKTVVIIPYDNPAQLADVAQLVEADAQYREAAKDYLNRTADQAPFARISSELLVAFDCMPQLEVPTEAKQGKTRVYELRTYESATERLGELKVEMFNNGEVPIFLDSGIRPVFFGRAIIGPQLPNLTYLTVYADDDSRTAAWKNFINHPDWKKLSAEPRYQKTVSKIDKWILAPKEYSQL